VVPIYHDMPGWKQDISACRLFMDLPREARDYVRFIEDATGVPVGYIGVGPGREEIIIR
jgi:adenylosuccinate synthase